MASTWSMTVIVTVWNRYDYIEDAIKYYEGMPFRVIISDSSRQSSDFQIDSENIEYLYHGPKLYSQTMQAVLREVETPYCVIVPDDDFFMITTAREYIDIMEAGGAKAAFGANLYFSGEFIQRFTSSPSYKGLKDYFSHDHFLPVNHGVVSTKEALEYFDLVASDPHLMTVRSHDATFTLCMGLVEPLYIDRKVFFLNRASSMTFTKGQRPDPLIERLYPAELRRNISFEKWLAEYRSREICALDYFIAEKRGIGAKEARDFAVNILNGIDASNKDRRPTLKRQSRRWRESVGRVASREWNALVAGRGAQPRPGGKGTISKILTRERRAVLGDDSGAPEMRRLDEKEEQA